MNEYTRREEIRWTLATVFTLVPTVAVAIVILVRAQGPMVTNPKAIEAETQAREQAAAFKTCPKYAERLSSEVPLFKTRAAQAERKAKEEASKRRRRRGTPLEIDIPWSAASPVLKQVQALTKGGCEKTAKQSASASKKAEQIWKTVRQASKLVAPKAGQEKEQHAVAKKLLELFDKAPTEALKQHTKAAQKALDRNLEEATEKRENALIRAPLPLGLFPRGAAIGVGVGIALAALLISYLSVWSASVRRARTLVALRRFANTAEAGMQAAGIVRLGAHHNAGEPGMVLGASLGGLLAAVAARPTNPNIFVADLFVAGAMGGLLVGLAIQWLTRTIEGTSRWRERVKELGDIEKPTIPVTLVLSGVTPGLEKQFLRYFEALSITDASAVVQQLAAKAEEQILVAADAAAQQQQAQGAPPQQPWRG